jgi:hypothetical protein
LVAATVGLGMALLLGEWVAGEAPLPRIQVLPLSGPVRVVDGTPVWRASEGSEARENAGCEGDPVLLVGSSILYGSGLSATESLGPALQARLPGACVHNHAQPAFTFDNQRVVAAEQVDAGAPPQVVVWEIWQNSVNRLDVIGDAAYNFGELVVDGGGVPSVLALGPGANRALFARSAMVRQLSVRLAPRRTNHALQPRWQALADGPLRDALVALQAAGSTPLLALMPALDRPFAESAADPYVGYAPVRAMADELGLPVVDVAQALSGQPVEELRLDPCCHYNAAGQQALADALAPEISALLR